MQWIRVTEVQDGDVLYLDYRVRTVERRRTEPDGGISLETRCTPGGKVRTFTLAAGTQVPRIRQAGEPVTKTRREIPELSPDAEPENRDWIRILHNAREAGQEE